MSLAARRALDIAVFGPITPLQRAVVRALAMRGHRMTLFQPAGADGGAAADAGAGAAAGGGDDDNDTPEWARLVTYSSGGTPNVNQALARAAGSDVVIRV